MKHELEHFGTRCIGTDNTDQSKWGETNVGLYHSSSFAYSTPEELENVFAGRAPGFVYSRINNPTVLAFERQMTSLEDGLGAIACSSGMAAISLLLMGLVRQDETVAASKSLFGGTYSLLTETLARVGIRTRFFDPTDADDLARVMDENVKTVFAESLGNPKLDITDIEGLVEVAHDWQIPLIIDSTATTPYLLNCRAFNADLVVHSASKFCDGQGRAIGGCVIDLGTNHWDRSRFPQLQAYTARYSQYGLLAYLRNDLLANLGCNLAPSHAEIYLNGLRTLPLRMTRHCKNAETLAAFLENCQEVTDVRYPGLSTHEGHETATRLYNGQYGALLTFDAQTREYAFEILRHLKLALLLANIGDVHTLAIHPASTIYLNHSEQQRRQMGVTPGLIRISVGLEDSRDIVADFQQALEIATQNKQQLCAKRLR